jgi:hypothetical protein
LFQKKFGKKIADPVKHGGIMVLVMPKVYVMRINSFFLKCANDMVIIIPEIEANQTDFHKAHLGKNRKFKQLFAKPYL